MTELLLCPFSDQNQKTRCEQCNLLAPCDDRHCPNAPAQGATDRDTIDTLTRQVLSYQEQLDARKWDPIETALRDSFIFLYCPEDGSRWLAKWQGDRWYGVDDCGLSRCGSSEGDPEVVTGWFLSHWQPLPASPAFASTKLCSPATEGGGE